jgi:hypothetical protein
VAEMKRVHKSISVPRGTGVEGLLQAVRGILTLGRVQEVVISARGEVSYSRLVAEDGEDPELEIDLGSLSPYAVIRTHRLEEIEVLPGDSAAVAMSRLFFAASRDGFFAIALATGPRTVFQEWHSRTTGVGVGADEAYGLPVLGDPDIPDDVLVLCAGPSRTSRLIDTRRSYKLVMARRPA